MERKQLEELGVTDDNTIKAIMKINGEDIETAKNNSKEESQKTIASVQKQLDEANNKIESFKDINPDDLKKEVAEWKQKAENAQKERDKIERDSVAKDLLRKSGVTDELSLTAILGEFNKKELKYENGTFIGAKEVIDVFKTQYPKHFEISDPNNNGQAGNQEGQEKKDGFDLGGNPPPAGKKDTRELLYGSK